MPLLSSNLSASIARSNFYQILDEVDSNMRQFTVSHRGKPKVMIMPIDEFASWQETLMILSDKKLSGSIGRAVKSKKTYSSEEANKLIGW